MLAMVLWQNPELGAIAVAVAATALAAVLWLYPPQIREEGQRWRWMLPGLRGMVIVALAVSLLKPVVTGPRSEAERGAIVLLVDQSKSMGVNDAGRSPAEKVALARGLGLIAQGSGAGPTAGLRAELENVRGLVERLSRARSEAEYARLSGRGVEAARARREDATAALRAAALALASRAPALRGAGELPRRLGELRKLPAPLDERALRDLRAKLEQMASAVTAVEMQADADAYWSNAKIRAICDEVDGASRIELVGRGLKAGNGLMQKLSADGRVLAYGFADNVTPMQAPVAASVRVSADRSDIVGAVRLAREQLRGQPVAAIVLVSDGRQVGREADFPTELEASGTAVFTVAAARGQERRDVSVAAVNAPAAAYVGESATIRVDVHAVNCRDQKLEIWLDAPGGKQSQQITVGDSSALTAEFRVSFSVAGAIDLGAGVSPIAGEATIDNNRAERWVKVLPESVAVTVASGAQTREFQWTAAALARTKWVSLRPVLLSGSSEVLPLAPEEILKQGVLVLCDVRSWSLTDAQWEAVERLVTERGGSVVFAVGDADVLREYAEHPIASRLLPFDPKAEISWRVWPGDRPHYALVPAAWSGAADSTNRPRWRNLPPVMAYMSMQQLNPNARAILAERETNAAVLAETLLGLGRTYVLGTDETWRWRSDSGGESEDLFWGTLVRQAAEAPYAAHEGNHWLDVDSLAIQPGQTLRVRAKVLREDGSPSPAAWQELQVFRDGQMVRTARLTRASTVGPGRYETAISDLIEGQYELRLSTGDDLAPAPRLVVRVTPSSSAELADLSGDEGLLRRIADASGGQFLTLEQLSSLPGRLNELTERQKGQMREYSLWDSPYLFLFVLSGLSLEWALRKRVGLA